MTGKFQSVPSSLHDNVQVFQRVCRVGYSRIGGGVDYDVELAAREDEGTNVAGMEDN